MKSALLLVFVALLAATTLGSSVGAVDVTSDGVRTAFYLRTQGAVEWGGNFIRIEAVEPSGASTVIETGPLWPTNAAGALLPWLNYGQVLPEDGEFLHVVERTWPAGTAFVFTFADRDGATLGQMTYGGGDVGVPAPRADARDLSLNSVKAKHIKPKHIKQ